MDWLPIENAPKKHGSRILAYEPSSGDIVTVEWLTGAAVGLDGDSDFADGWHVDDGKNDPIWYRYQHLFTHWMPLPPPPQAAKD